MNDFVNRPNTIVNKSVSLEGIRQQAGEADSTGGFASLLSDINSPPTRANRLRSWRLDAA